MPIKYRFQKYKKYSILLYSSPIYLRLCPQALRRKTLQFHQREYVLICKDIAARASTTESCFAPSLSPAAICIFLFLNQSCS